MIHLQAQQYPSFKNRAELRPTFMERIAESIDTGTQVDFSCEYAVILPLVGGIKQGAIDIVS